ncbi:MAG TPA: flagellar biosynthesis anti-sigma factor FlgM [Spirochaetia bacterium]|nr:flagellar biosynthesis anti-sigma factor FlgM [Spirochaetia bacterium]
MTIQGIGPLDPITKYNKTEKPEKAVKADKSDSINVSQEAKSKAEVYNTIELAKNADDIRWSRVEEVKRKLEDPNYLSEKVIEETASKIMDQFNL